MNTEKLWFVIDNETNVFFKVEETIIDSIFKLTSQETNKNSFIHEFEFKNKIESLKYTLFDVLQSGTYITYFSDSVDLYYVVKSFFFTNGSLTYNVELKGVLEPVSLEITHDEMKNYRVLKDCEIPLNIL